MTAAEADATPSATDTAALARLEHDLRLVGRRINGPEFVAALEAAAELGPVELVDLWRYLEGLRRVLYLAGEELQARLLPHVARERLVVHPLGAFEWQGGTDRKAWDHPRLLARIRAVATSRPWRKVDDETGELEAEADALWRAVMAAGRIDYRAGTFDGKRPGLKALGIDPGDYCEETKGRATVRAAWLPEVLDLFHETEPDDPRPRLALVAELEASLEAAGVEVPADG